MVFEEQHLEYGKQIAVDELSMLNDVAPYLFTITESPT